MRVWENKWKEKKVLLKQILLLFFLILLGTFFPAMFRFSKISSRKTKKHSIHWTWGQVSCNSYTLWKLSIQKKNIINPIHLSFQNFLLEKQNNKIKKSPEFFLLKFFFLCQSRYWHMQICISTHCSCSVSPNASTLCDTDVSSRAF